MTVDKALKILGLKAPYTEEDLKKTYRSLIVMTHPDSVKEHDYEYDASDINAAYEYLLSHNPSAEIESSKSMFSRKKSGWNAEINNNAYLEREIYHNVEDFDGDIIGRAVVAKGKYTWCKDEDFSLFLLSIYNCSKKIIIDNDEKTNRDRSSDIVLQGEIAYLLAQQYVDTKMILSMTESMGTDSDSLPMYKIKGMLERTSYSIKLTKDEVIFPAGVKNHKLYVKNKDGVIGYVSFKDDRLYYGIIPLFERKVVQVKMNLREAKTTKRRGSIFYDIEMVIKLLDENKSNMIDSVNLKIEKILEENLL